MREQLVKPMSRHEMEKRKKWGLFLRVSPIWFVSAGFTQAFSKIIDGIDSSNIGISAARTAAASVAGGISSVLGGGKLSNGAYTGAFSRLFIDDRHQEMMLEMLTSELEELQTN